MARLSRDNIATSERDLRGDCGGETDEQLNHRLMPRELTEHGCLWIVDREEREVAEPASLFGQSSENPEQIHQERESADDPGCFGAFARQGRGERRQTAEGDEETGQGDGELDESSRSDVPTEDECSSCERDLAREDEDKDAAEQSDLLADEQVNTRNWYREPEISRASLDLLGYDGRPLRSARRRGGLSLAR
jgi:hypothetical protein